MTVHLRATLALLLLPLLAAPAVGQNSQRPVIITPPMGDYELPPSGQTPASTPTAAPTSPTAPVQPVPLASPTPRATSPTPRAPVAARSTSDRVDSPAAVVTPSPSASVMAEPDETASPEPTPVASPSPSVAPPRAADAEPAASQWLWLGLAALALLAGGGAAGWLLGRRRRRIDQDAEHVETPRAVPAAVAPPPSPSPPVLPRPATPARPAPAPMPPVAPPEGALVTELRPLRAAIHGGIIRLEFELLVRNRGAESAENIRAVLGLIGANAQQDEQIARFHAAARMASGTDPFSLAAGSIHVLNGQVSLPGDQMAAVTVQGKPMFVPVVPVMLKWYSGLSIRTMRDAFMVGTVPAPGSDRLGPLWLERAADGFGRLAAKRYAPRA